MNYMSSNIIQKILTLHKVEVESDKLQKIPYSSYSELIEEVLSSLSERKLDYRYIDEIKNILVNTLISLISRRIEKILNMIKKGEQIPEDILLSEEKKLVTPIIKLRSLEKVEKKEVLTLVSFKMPFPILYLSKNKRLGPFNKFDIVTLGRSEAIELEKKKVVEIIE